MLDPSYDPRYDRYCNVHLLSSDLTTRKLGTKLYDKRNEFNSPIVIFLFLSSIIPILPAYSVFASSEMC